MKVKGMLIFIGCILLLASSNIFAAETTAPTAAPTPQDVEKTPSLLDMFHNPTPWLEMGADVRLRHEYARNPIFFNNQQVTNTGAPESRDHYNYQRYRMRVWTKFKLDENIDFNVRWCMEPRSWQDPHSQTYNTDEINNTDILWDIFNITWRKMFDLPLTMVAGRQEFMLGKGWLTGDGTPLDGSRTFYQDALRFTYMLREPTALDLIYIHNDPDVNHRLRAFNSQDKVIAQQEEEGAIVYLTDKSIENMQLEGYFMFRNDNPLDRAATNYTAPGLVWSRDGEIYTFGGAVSGTLNTNWNYRVEGAFQTGEQATTDSAGLKKNNLPYTDNYEDLQGYGAKAELEYCFKDEHDNKLGVTYEYLSGDDPDTNKIESFDPMWGEWPQWSDLFQNNFGYKNEGFISNLHRFALTHKFKPTQKMELIHNYNLLWADENTYSPGTPLGSSEYSNSGKFRGQLLTSMVKYTWTKNIKSYLQGEYFLPGGYYSDASQDHGVFFRANLEITF